jgi:hypothetical protein
LNITHEKDLMRRRPHCHRFLCKETCVTIATIANDVGSRQWQWWGLATLAETEAAAGAHNNQPTNCSYMAAEKAFAVAAAATAAAVVAASDAGSNGGNDGNGSGAYRGSGNGGT